jgi:D-glycero-D-manno-heptose 1,7-bisphosphate phosphatase
MALARHARWKTVLLDRDGVINRMMPNYVKSMGELELLAGAIDAVVRLSTSGRAVIVITNQSAIGRGIIGRAAVDEIHEHLDELVRERGGSIRGFLVCPHAPDAGCDCRKPAPGLILQARDRFDADLARTVLVGDQVSDLQAAAAAGCDAILVGDDAPARELAATTAVPVVAALPQAAELICAA